RVEGLVDLVERVTSDDRADAPVVSEGQDLLELVVGPPIAACNRAFGAYAEERVRKRPASEADEDDDSFPSRGRRRRPEAGVAPDQVDDRLCAFAAREPHDLARGVSSRVHHIRGAEFRCGLEPVDRNVRGDDACGRSEGLEDLQGHVSQAANAEYGDGRTRVEVRQDLLDRPVGSETGVRQRGCLYRVEAVELDQKSFGWNVHEFRVTTCSNPLPHVAALLV